MTAQVILTEIYCSDEVKEVVGKLEPQNLQQDILQHTFLELFEKPAKFIEDLHQRGKLKAYIVKILFNTATYTRTKFRKELGKETPTDFCADSKYEVINAGDDYKVDAERVNSVACAVKKLEEKHWYDAGILKLYAELGTISAVSRATGIPRTSVFKTLVRAKATIKTDIEHD